MKKSWLQQNLAAILALYFTTFAFALYLLVLTKSVCSDENTTFLIISSVTNIFMLIIGYIYGSSDGSKVKQERIDKLTDDKAAQ